MMLKCEAIFVLDGWEQSKGALLEVSIANEMEMPVYTLGQAWVSDRRAELLAGQRMGSTQGEMVSGITNGGKHGALSS